ncbi:MAG: two-component sensor histidine kinase, partial [Microvirga sp.]
MSGLGKLLRSTAFRLLLAYLFVFTVFAFFTIGYVAWNARRVLDDQIVSTIEAEITGLSEQYRTGGIRRLVNVIERRASEP